MIRIIKYLLLGATANLIVPVVGDPSPPRAWTASALLLISLILIIIDDSNSR